MEIKSKRTPDMVCVTISGDHKELCKAIAQVIQKENHKRLMHGQVSIPYIINQDSSLRPSRPEKAQNRETCSRLEIARGSSSIKVSIEQTIIEGDKIKIKSLSEESE